MSPAASYQDEATEQIATQGVTGPKILTLNNSYLPGKYTVTLALTSGVGPLYAFLYVSSIPPNGVATDGSQVVPGSIPFTVSSDQPTVTQTVDVAAPGTPSTPVQPGQAIAAKGPKKVTWAGPRVPARPVASPPAITTLSRKR